MVDHLKDIVHCSADVTRYVSRTPVTLRTRFRPLIQCIMASAIVAQVSVVWPQLHTYLGHYIVPPRVVVTLQALYARDPKCFVFVLMLLCFCVHRSFPAPSNEEVLLVMRSLGVQTTSRGTSRFIPIDEIRDIVIHEGFRGFEVRFYLALLLKDKSDPDLVDIEIVFPDTLPRRRFLEQVWVDARRALFDK